MNFLQEIEQPEYTTINPLVNHYMFTHMNPDITAIGAWFSINTKTNIYTLNCVQTGELYIIVIDDKNYEAALEQTIHLLKLNGEIVCISYNHIKDMYDCWLKDNKNDILYFQLRPYMKKVYHV